jgi:hypothetical protein
MAFCISCNYYLSMFSWTWFWGPHDAGLRVETCPVKMHLHQVFPVNCFTGFGLLINCLSLIIWLLSNPPNFSPACHVFWPVTGDSRKLNLHLWQIGSTIWKAWSLVFGFLMIALLFSQKKNECTTELAALIYDCLGNRSFRSTECQWFLCKNRNMLRPLVKNVLRSTPNSEVWLMSLTIGAGLPFVDRDPRQSTSGAHMQAVECAEDPDVPPCATAFCYCGWLATQAFHAELWDLPEQVSCFTCSRLRLSNRIDSLALSWKSCSLSVQMLDVSQG